MSWRIKVVIVTALLVVLCAASVICFGPYAFIADAGGNPQHNIRDITRAYSDFLRESASAQTPRRIEVKSGDTVHDAAFILATEKQFNDAGVYFNPSRRSGSSWHVANELPGGGLKMDSDFARSRLDIVLVANITYDATWSTLIPPPTWTEPIKGSPIRTARASLIPVSWTRGLQQNGTWSADSPWKGEGGFIGFLDGHVEWFDKLSKNPGGEALVNYRTGEMTVNYFNALPPGAVVLSPEPKQQK